MIERWAPVMLVAGAVLLGGAAVMPSQTKPAGGDAWLSRPVDDRTYRTYLDFFAYDRQAPLDVKTTKNEEVDGVRVERLSYRSAAGMRVTALLIQPGDAAVPKRGAVIFLHGGVAAAKDSPLVLAWASLLSRAGWTVLAIDLLHFGERTTDMLTTFSEEEKHDRLYNQPGAYLAWVTQTVKDVSRGYDLLVSRGVDAKRIALAGFSRGGILASIVGAAEARLAGVALLFAAHFDALEHTHAAAACPANYIGRIAPRPLLMVNGVQDTDMIKDRAVEPLFRLARQPKQIIWTDGGHGFWTDTHRGMLIQWLRERIK
jgi:dienelactone hydrolase